MEIFWLSLSSALTGLKLKIRMLPKNQIKINALRFVIGLCVFRYPMLCLLYFSIDKICSSIPSVNIISLGRISFTVNLHMVEFAFITSLFTIAVGLVGL